MKWLADALFAVTGIPASIHLYASAPGAQVLPPHTDPYDVLVWQLTGTKHWHTCLAPTLPVPLTRTRTQARA